MTNEEAISWLRTTMSNAEQLCECEKEAFEIAINALEETIKLDRNAPVENKFNLWDIFERLTKAFQNGIITSTGEFVAHKSGEYFNLRNCKTELDVKCKVLEWLSRAAFKTEPYGSRAKNDEFHIFMLSGINSFLGTRFTESDMETIYTYLGNAIKHEKTKEFIEIAHYNMSFFNQFE